MRKAARCAGRRGTLTSPSSWRHATHPPHPPNTHERRTRERDEEWRHGFARERLGKSVTLVGAGGEDGPLRPLVGALSFRLLLAHRHLAHSPPTRRHRPRRLLFGASKSSHVFLLVATCVAATRHAPLLRCFEHSAKHHARVASVGSSARGSLAPWLGACVWVGGF